MADSSDPSTGTELTPLERVVDRALFWPFDLGVRCAEELPAAAGRVRDQLVVARFIGRLAVQQGNAEIRRRLEPTPDEPADPPPAPPSAAEAPPAHPAEAVTEALDVEALALPDYDQLPAVHIIEKLAGLTEAERARIEAYESTHRGRRTVLGKLERLRGS